MAKHTATAALAATSSLGLDICVYNNRELYRVITTVQKLQMWSQYIKLECSVYLIAGEAFGNLPYKMTLLWKG